MRLFSEETSKTGQNLRELNVLVEPAVCNYNLIVFQILATI